MPPKPFWLALGFAGVLACCGLSIVIGVRVVSGADLLAGLSGSVENISQAAIAKRIPRTIMAALGGAALGLSGAVMQAITRNPLADPGILGVNAGAAFAVTLGIAWFGMALSVTYVAVAILGAALAAAFVYVVGSAGPGGATPLKLALAGTATSVALASLMNAVILGRNDIANSVQYWMVGGVGGVTMDRVGLVAPFLALGFVLGAWTAPRLNSLALGDELAAGVGENVALTRAVSALGAVILAGATTAICGPIGFVGLAVPHMCRLIIGVDHRWLLPLSAFGGAILLLAADVLGRVLVRPAELEVGIVTALVGVPIFIIIVRRQRVRDL
ncbi:FecCD family ABC transporter permease [Pseudoroseicyclus aestuarii]|uniref:Iron complex transport system permease protein n=1 Tax=Pseudoroseicyclus aestuarii TaxID=1795041 RepID=A0A318T475_9RHOB|nr:iron ABC transporter permease [Pseudoroseicyclus aestuarii]PYE81318.1 iron complex transport system permease protein [Pseudoroseicyclus aestuarii]